MNTPSDSILLTGAGGLPKVHLACADGAQVDVYLHGGHVTSWIPSGGEERLFLSRSSEFHPGAAIRGGVPVIFPQFGSLGKLPKHGFARLQPWELSSVGGDHQGCAVEFYLVDNEATRLLWPYSFLLKLKVSLGGRRLALNFCISNTGSQPFSFTTALHTYLHIANILDTHIEGLHGLRYHDTVNRGAPVDWVEMEQAAPLLAFTGEVDRVYHAVDRPLKVVEPDRVITITTEGFPDVVVWNPGPQKAARLADLEPDGYLKMVCVEAAVAGEPLTLSPGGSWQGAQVLSSL
jgi:glucose-6-phosphate 1-epimerase